MAGAIDAVAKNVEQMSPAMDRLIRSTNMVYDGMLKIAQVSFDGAINSANKLASALKGIANDSLEVSMNHEVRMATITQMIENKNKNMNLGMSEAQMAAQAGVRFQKAQSIRENSLLEDNDIFNGLRVMGDMGYKEDSKEVQLAVDVASAKKKSMTEVANAFKLLNSGDYHRGMQAAIDLGLDKDALLQDKRVKGKFNGYNNQNYTGDTQPLVDAIMDQFGVNYAGVAQAQSETLEGTWGTIRLRLEQIYLKALGFDENGLIKKGSVFESLQELSTKVSKALTIIRDFKFPEGLEGAGIVQRFSAVFGAIGDQISKWYHSDGGKQIIEDLAEDMGEGLATMLMSIFGIKLSGQDENVFVSIGKSVASGFWEGFSNAFDISKFIQSTLGKVAVTVGAGLLGSLLLGPGGGMLFASLAGIATSWFDGQGSNPLEIAGVSSALGAEGMPNQDLMDHMQTLLANPPTGGDLFVGVMATLTGALLVLSRGKLFKDGLIPKIFDKYFKKDTNYPKEINTKMDKLINPLDEIVSKLGGIAEQLNRIIECVCNSCDCDDLGSGKVSKAKHKVQEDDNRARGGDAISDHLDQREREVAQQNNGGKGNKGGRMKRLWNKLTGKKSVVDDVADAVDGDDRSRGGKVVDMTERLNQRSNNTERAANSANKNGKVVNLAERRNQRFNTDRAADSVESSNDTGTAFQQVQKEQEQVAKSDSKEKKSFGKRVLEKLFKSRAGKIIVGAGAVATTLFGINEAAEASNGLAPNGVATEPSSWVDSVTSFGEGVVSSVGTFIGETGSAIAEATSSGDALLSAVGSILPDLGGMAGAWAGGEAGASLGAMVGTMIAPGLGTTIGGAVGGVVGSIVGGIFGEEAVVWMQGALGSVMGFLGTVGSLFSGAWTSIVSGVSTFGMNLWTGLTTWLGQTWTAVSTWVSGIWTSFTTWLGQIPTAAGGWMMGLWTTVTTWLTQLWTDAGLFLSNIAGSFGSWFKTAFDNAVLWVMGLPDAIVGFISSIPERVGEFVEGIGATFLNIGSTIITSIRDGIVSAYEGLSGIARWGLEKAMKGMEFIVNAVGGGKSSGGGKATGAMAAPQYHGGGLVENEGWAILERKEMVLDENLSSFIRTSAAKTTGQGATGTNSGPVSIQIGALANTLQVREEADIHNIAAALSNELKRVLTNQGVYTQAEVAR